MPPGWLPVRAAVLGRQLELPPLRAGLEPCALVVPARSKWRKPTAELRRSSAAFSWRSLPPVSIDDSQIAALALFCSTIKEVLGGSDEKPTRSPNYPHCA